MLKKMADLSLMPASAKDDIRGYRVLDSAGQVLGKVSAILVDEDTRRVRFLEVRSGGFLGIGAEHLVFPVEVVARVAEDGVHIDRTREHVAGAPPYDPALVQEDYFDKVYRYYERYGAGGFPFAGGFPPAEHER